MPDHEGSTRVTTHPPRRRWLRRITLSLLLLAVFAVGRCWGWGKYAEKGMSDRIAAAVAAGEPVTADDLLAGPPVAAGENAVPEIRAAMASINTDSETWKAYQDWNENGPLSADEAAMLKRLVDESP